LHRARSSGSSRVEAYNVQYAGCNSTGTIKHN
jgi:hypothetical protein